MTTTIAHRQQPAVGAAGARHPLLSFTNLVPRHLVHRRALAEVVLADWYRTSDNTYACAAQWPRGHSLYRVLNGHHDPLQMAETMRQTGILLAHVGEDVPLDWNFIMDRIAVSADLDGLRAGLAPADVVVEAELSPLRNRTRLMAHLRLDTRFFRDGKACGTASAWMRCVAPAVYDRLRGEHPCTTTAASAALPPVDPRTVGMSTETDVVLGTTSSHGAGWPLRVRTDHPVLFDHPLDHVPGMLVLEGFRQAGRAMLRQPDAQLTSFDVTFTRYLELDRPAVLMTNTGQSATSAGAALTLSVVQDGQPAVTGVGELRCTSDTALAA